MNPQLYIPTEEIIFDAKPEAVPYNYRASYKVAQLCLIINLCCVREGCSLLKLHMISTALSTKKYKEELNDLLNKQISSYSIIRFDPVVNRALKYARAEGLIKQQGNGLFRLTPLGKQFCKQIIKAPDLMSAEKNYLFSISNKLPEKKIKELTKFWRYTNVEDK